MVQLGEELSKGRDLGHPRFGGPEAGILLGKRKVVARGRVTGGVGESQMRLLENTWWDACFWGLEDEEGDNKCCYGD